MAQYTSLTLDVPASDSNGTALRVDGNENKWVEISGTFSATVTIQMSFDGGTVWRDHSVFTAAGGGFVDAPCTHLRAVTSSYSSGTPAGLVRVAGP